MSHMVQWKALLVAVAAFAFLVTLSACRGSDSKPAQTSSAATPATATSTGAAVAPSAQQQAITVTDVVGRKVTVKAPIKSMILSEGRILYIVAPLEPTDPFKRIVGWGDDLRTADLDAYEKYKEKFPHLTRITIFGGTAQGAFSVEKAIDLQPDVVVLTYDSYNGARGTGLIDKLAAAGIPTVVVDFRQYPLENTVPSVLLMGRLMGQQERAQQLADYYTEQVNLVYERLEKVKQPKPSTFLYRAAGLLECCATFGNGNLGLLVERAGGANIGSKFLPGWSGTLNPEQVIASDPEVIIVTGANWTNSDQDGGFVSMGYTTPPTLAQEQLRALVNNTPGWQSLRAVKNRRTYAIWHQFYNSPYSFVALMQFAKWLYPQDFADVDPDAVFREFHQKFLPIPYSGTFWVTLP